MTQDLFPTTAWTLLHAAQRTDNDARMQDRNQFLARYARPVFVFLRARSWSTEQAEEWTQEFFLTLLEGDELRRVDGERGSFRAFLLTLLQRFVADQMPTRVRRQRAFEQEQHSLTGVLTEADRCWEPAAGETAEGLFLRQWAIHLVAEVRRRLKVMCVQKGREAWYGLFEAQQTLEPWTEAPSTAELARRTGLTHDQVRYALEQTQQWFRALLRKEVREQVGSDEEVGDEIRELLACLRR